MANFSQGFTGKDTAITLPSNEGVQRAQQGLNAIITQAEELRYKTWKDNKDQFLKNATIDPVFVLSDSSRKSQMALINNFNKKWGKKAQETNYNFTEQDRQDMLTEKNFIISEAQNQQAQMQRFLQHRDMVAKDIQGLYDTNAFGEAMDRYMETGIYDLSRPPLKALSPSSYLSGMANKETGEYIMGDKTDQVTMPSGQVAYRTFNIDPKSVGDWLAPRILSMPEQYQLGMVKEWADLPQPEKDKWLNMADTNQDKQIDEGEKKNAILEWAKDRYTRDVLKPKLSTPKGVAGANNRGMSNLKAFGKNTSYAPTEAKPTRLGQTDYSNYHTFNNLPAWDIPVGTTIRLLNPKGEKEMKPDNTLSVDITGYDEDKDEFTFIVKSNFENLYGAVPAMERGKDWRIAIKRKDLPPEYNTLEIMKNGKVVKVGDIKRESVTITPTPAKEQKTNVSSIFNK